MRGATCLMFLAAAVLMSCTTPPAPSSLKHADAIVLLAGSYRERAPVAASLYRSGAAPLIILTNDGVGGGWSAGHNRNLTVIEWTTEFLAAAGVPRERIVQLPFYRSGTIYDALAVRRYAAGNGQKRLIVVTSDYHARRVRWCFDRTAAENPLEFSVVTGTTAGGGIQEPVVEGIKYAWYRFKYSVVGLEPRLD